MRRNRLKTRHVLFAAAFLLALMIRMAGAGRPVSTDAEAALALQAREVFSNPGLLLLPQPAYLTLTSPLMFLFGAMDWVARFWPVLAGSLLVLTPALFQRWFGTLPAVLLAFVLALEPGLVAASLQVNSTTLALLFVVLAFGFWINGRMAWAGIAAGFALLSGPTLWPGVIGLAIAYGLTSRFIWRKTEEVEPNPLAETAAPSPDSHPTAWRTALLYALGTLFFAGTLFFILPRGLSAAAASLPAYLQGWLEPSGISVSLLLVALLLYSFLLLPFGLFRGIAGWLRENRADQFLFTWFVAALVLALVYPGRQVSDLVWPVLPLAALAARQFAYLFQVRPFERLATLGQALLALLILGYLSLTLVGLSTQLMSGSSQEHTVRIAGAVIMLAASTGLIAWGWSRQIALRGLAWGFALILLIYSFSTAWSTVVLPRYDGQELWLGPQRLPNANLMHETINLLNQWGGAGSSGLELVVVGVDSPALRWSLRDLRNVRYVNFLSAESNPPLVITVENPTVSLGAAYRGQDFILAENTDWNQVRPVEWFRWLVFRSLPGGRTSQEQIILWARTDLFPGAEVAEQSPEEVELLGEGDGPQ